MKGLFFFESLGVPEGSPEKETQVGSPQRGIRAQGFENVLVF